MGTPKAKSSATAKKNELEKPKKTVRKAAKKPSTKATKPKIAIGVDETDIENAKGLLKIYLNGIISGAVKSAKKDKRGDVNAGDITLALQSTISSPASSAVKAKKRATKSIATSIAADTETHVFDDLKPRLKEYMNTVLHAAAANAKKAKRGEISANDIKGAIKVKNTAAGHTAALSKTPSKKLDGALELVVREAHSEHSRRSSTPVRATNYAEMTGKLRGFLEDVVCESVMSTERANRKDITGADVTSAVKKKLQKA